MLTNIIDTGFTKKLLKSMLNNVDSIFRRSGITYWIVSNTPCQVCHDLGEHVEIGILIQDEKHQKCRRHLFREHGIRLIRRHLRLSYLSLFSELNNTNDWEWYRFVQPFIDIYIFFNQNRTIRLHNPWTRHILKTQINNYAFTSDQITHLQRLVLSDRPRSLR